MRTWTLGKKLEIAIYQFADRSNRGEPKATSVAILAGLVPMSQNIDVTDALLRMYRRGHIALDKYDPSEGRFVPLREFPSEVNLFYGPPYGDFRVGITPEGREDFEHQTLQQPIVFISCGQYYQQEKDLGQQLLTAVNHTPPLRGYFAEYQTSLSNLSKHIFEALDQCVAIVTVMHHRGTVTTQNQEHLRASVWIEQEIAIAAFLTERLGRKIEIAAYIQKGIHREGLRAQLILNPIEFDTEEQVLKHFQTLLPAWKTLVS